MRRARGFTYLMVLFMVALTGVGLVAFSAAWERVRQREREAELLFIGDQIRRAIASYHEATPGPAKRYPASLDDLLKDPRFPEPRRHLRRPWPDPFDSGAEWVLLKAPQGGLWGVASTSTLAPLKRTGFEGADRVFEAQAEKLGDKLRYRDWEFIHDPGLRSASPAGQGAGTGGGG